MNTNETKISADTAIDDEADLVSLGAVTVPRAGDATSSATVSPLVATVHTPTATAAAPVLRPLNVIVKAPVGIAATAVVMVILLPENAEVAVRVATDEVPATLAAGAAVVSYQPVGNQKLIVPAIATVLVAENAMTSVEEAVARAVDEGVAVKAVTCVPRPPESTAGEGAGFVSVVTVMSPPVVAEPIVSPDKVMVKAAPAAIPITAVVMTTEVAPVAAAAAVIDGTDVEPAALAVAVIDVAKNPDG